MKEKDAHYDAKMKVLEELRAMAHEMMGSDLGKPEDMKQVSVAAPDEEGLEKGLDLASSLMDKKELPMDDEADEEGDESAEDLERQIQDLMARKASLEQKA